MTWTLADIARCLDGIGGLGSPEAATEDGGVLRVQVRRGSGAGCPGYLDHALEQVAAERLAAGLPHAGGVQVEIVG